MLTMLGAIATFEREMMLERQREGITRAKEDGRYKGRKPTARAKAANVISLYKDGLSKQKIADLRCEVCQFSQRNSQMTLPDCPKVNHAPTQKVSPL
jgi:DNA invertase Pin-like site-specific DNA recombinase